MPLLELARRRNQISEEVHQELRGQIEEIGKMLAGLINGVSNRVNR